MLTRYLQLLQIEENQIKLTHLISQLSVYVSSLLLKKNNATEMAVVTILVA